VLKVSLREWGGFSCVLWWVKALAVEMGAWADWAISSVRGRRGDRPVV
jgi:hypothetical protein